jgi:GT2 family glycosyltransferase
MVKSNEIKLSISIVNYNTTEFVLKLIESIKEYSNGIDYEILVFDNASSDSPERITNKFNEVKLIKNDRNLFFTKADNQNVIRSKGKYILSINPDTLVTANAIQNMINFLDSNTDVAAVTPKFIFPDNKLQASFAPFLTSKTCIQEALHKLFSVKSNLSDNIGSIFYDSEVSQQAEILYGACIMVRRDVINKIGLKDEKFVHGWDEYDWCMRANKAGLKLFYIHNSIITHYRSVTIKEISTDFQKSSIVDKLGRDGYHYLIIKHFGYSTFFLLKLIWSFERLKNFLSNLFNKSK